jgi:hypothetical protein
MAGEKLAIDELRDIVIAGLRLEAKAHPQYVGEPFSVATLIPGEHGVVGSYTG